MELSKRQQETCELLKAHQSLEGEVAELQSQLKGGGAVMCFQLKQLHLLLICTVTLRGAPCVEPVLMASLPAGRLGDSWPFMSGLQRHRALWGNRLSSRWLSKQAHQPTPRQSPPGSSI